MVSIQSKDGVKRGRQEIADVFADFYQDLFAARSGGLEKKPWAEEDGKETEAMTSGEIRKQLKKMAKHKAADHKGLVVEMLQEGSNKLLELIADVEDGSASANSFSLSDI